MADFSFTGQPNAPGAASYAAPLLSFQPLGDLAKNYYEGTQEKNTLDKQQLFRNGIPRDPQGNLDLNKITDMVAKTGGYEGVAPLITQQLQLKAGADLANAGAPPEPGHPGQPTSRPAVPGQGGPTSAPIPGQPTLSATGGDTGDQGAPTIRSMVTEFGGGKEMTPVISQIVRQLRINPDGPLNGDQAGQVKQLYAQLNGGGAAPGQQSGQSGAQSGPAPAVADAPQPGSPAGVLQGDSIAASQALRARAANIQKYATAYANVNKPAAEEAQKTATALSAQADKMDERLSTAAQRPANIQQKVVEKENENEVVQSQKTYNGMHAISNQFETTLEPAIQIAKGILNQPDMYSGIGGHLSLDFNKIKAALGDNAAATLQEGLQKINAISVLAQVNQQKDEMQEAGAASSRIFAQQVDQVAKASASMENTVSGNRFLVNFQDRMGQFSKVLTQQAQDYIKAHGHLDPQFDKQISSYIKAHPIFSDQERADPRILGAPDAPHGQKSKADVLAWAGKMGLKSGDPFRTPAGDVRYVP